MVCGRLPFNDSSLHSLIAQTRRKPVFPTGNLCSPGINSHSTQTKTGGGGGGGRSSIGGSR